MKKEPVLLASVVLAWLISLGLGALGVIPPPDVSEALTELAVLGAMGLLARSQVFSKDTLRDANLDPEQVARDAKDPNVERKEEPKRLDSKL